MIAFPCKISLSKAKAPFCRLFSKYLDMIVQAWGTWELFQSLLSVLRTIGDQHGRSIANVAIRWVLDHPFVGAVIIGEYWALIPPLHKPNLEPPIGARLGLSEHPDDNKKVFGFQLTQYDNIAIESVLDRSNGRRIITSIGDCGAEYR